MVALPRFEEPRMLDVQKVTTGVDAVSAVAGAGSILEELAVADNDARAGATAQNAVLVVDELDVIHGQVTAVKPNSGSIHVGYARSRQGHIAHRGVIPANNEDSLLHARLVGDDSACVGSAALDHQVVRPPYCAIEILTRPDHDMITIPSHRWLLATELYTACPTRPRWFEPRGYLRSKARPKPPGRTAKSG